MPLRVTEVSLLVADRKTDIIAGNGVMGHDWAPGA